MSNNEILIKYNNGNNNYDLKVVENNGMLFVTKVKTSKQRKFRAIKEFYRENNNIKENQIDLMLERFGRNQQSVREQFEENNKIIEKLGINKKEVIDLYKKKLIEEIKKRKYK